MQRLFLLLLLLLSQSVRAQTNLYVDSSVATSGAGTSWATAYKTLNEALNFANNASTTISYNVHIARGAYYPTGLRSAMNRDSAFVVLRNGVRIYGGYPSGGGTRNATANPTILSGDIGVANDSTDNSYHVVVMATIPATGDSTILDGVTIAYGNANGTGSKFYNSQTAYQSKGGGLWLSQVGAKTLIRNCIVRNHSGTNGGGLYLENAATNFEVIRFDGNKASYGGAVYTSSGTANQNFRNCTFSGNRASIEGGGVFINYGSICLFWDCAFTQNTASNSNAVTKGGAIRAQNYCSVVRCGFQQNTASTGGALHLSAGAIIDTCTFTGNKAGAGDGGAVAYTQAAQFADPIYCYNTSFTANTALAGDGGAIADKARPNYTSGYVNCTFTADSAKRGGALYISSKSNLSSSLLISNYASGKGGAIYNIDKFMGIRTSRISGNSADTAGGGLFLGSSNTTREVFNALFSGNKAGRQGGAIATVDNGGSLRMENCTLAGDSAISGNGLYCENASPLLTNCIVWEGASNGIYITGASYPDITYSLVAGGFSSGTGNTSTNPAFTNPQPATAAPTTTGDYHLTACSPAINTGQNNNPSYYLDMPYDLDGNPRLVDDTVDMGAYEFQPQAVTGTLSGAASICAGATTPLTSTVAGGVWSSANPARTAVSATGVVTGISAGTDTIRYTVMSNGCAVVAKKAITILPRPATPVVTVNGNTPICKGAAYTATASPAGGAWAIGDTTITSLQYNTGSTAYFRAKAAGATALYYTITGSNGCAATDTIPLTVNPLPTVAPTTGGNSVCVGATLQLSNATAGGVWSGAGNTSVFTISNSGLVTAIAAGNGYVYYTVTSAAGCTGRDTLSLTIKPATIVPAISGPATVCVGKPFTYTNTATGGTWSVVNSGASITPAGVYTAMTTGSNLIRYVVNDPVTGCPGKAEKSVVGAGPVTKAVSATFCGPANANYNFGGQILTAAGVYTKTFQTYYGCDSVVTLTYTDSRPDSGVTQSGNTLTAVATNAIYKWFRCNPDGTFTSTGASLRSFTPAANGSYRVEITSGSCTVRSACFPVTGLGVSSIATEDWRLYPNPTTGNATLQTGSVVAKKILLQDVTGKTLLETSPTSTETMLDLKGFAPGLYLVTVADGEGHTATLRLTVAGR